MCMRRLIALLMLLYVAAGEARAHSWYTGLYSGRGEQCCGGLDCGPLNPVFFRHEPDGTIDVWRGGYWYPVTEDRILHIPSPDGRIHLCFWGGEPRCLIMPGAL